MFQNSNFVPGLVVLDEKLETLNILEFDELERDQVPRFKLGRGQLNVLKRS